MPPTNRQAKLIFDLTDNFFSNIIIDNDKLYKSSLKHKPSKRGAYALNSKP